MPTAPALQALDRDLRTIFGNRLQSVVAYAPAAPVDQHETATLAIVESISAADLRACAARVADWHDARLATPLLLETHEFARSLDAFPFEFGAILADHVVVSGASPFAGLQVDAADLRHACEVQARSHLLHFREGCIETAGRSDALAELIRQSAPALAALVRNVSRLDAAFVPAPVFNAVVNFAGQPSVSSEEARQLLPDYLTALHDLVKRIDRWAAR